MDREALDGVVKMLSSVLQTANYIICSDDIVSLSGHNGVVGTSSTSNFVISRMTYQSSMGSVRPDTGTVGESVGASMSAMLFGYGIVQNA